MSVFRENTKGKSFPNHSRRSEEFSMIHYPDFCCSLLAFSVVYLHKTLHYVKYHFAPDSFFFVIENKLMNTSETFCIRV